MHAGAPSIRPGIFAPLGFRPYMPGGAKIPATTFFALVGATQLPKAKGRCNTTGEG